MECRTQGRDVGCSDSGQNDVSPKPLSPSGSGLDGGHHSYLLLRPDLGLKHTKAATKCSVHL